MSRRSTSEGMITRAFADHLGKSVQWARKLKRENAPEWQEYIARRATVAAPASGKAATPAAPAESPQAAAGAMLSPVADLIRAAEAKERTWIIFDRAAAAAEKGSIDLTEQAALNRAAKEARDAYEKACKHAAHAAQAAQRWVSIERVAAIRSALRQLEDVVQNWETTLSGKLPDAMRPAFHAAFAESKPGWNKGIAAVDEYIQTLLPVPC